MPKNPANHQTGPLTQMSLLDRLARAIGPLVTSRLVHFIALLGLCAAYIQGGLTKLFDFNAAIAETQNLGLPFGPATAVATIVTELGGSALILSGVYRWLGALWLAAFTLIATFVANRFWEIPQPDRFIDARQWQGRCSIRSAPGKQRSVLDAGVERPVCAPRLFVRRGQVWIDEHAGDFALALRRLGFVRQRLSRSALHLRAAQRLLRDEPDRRHRAVGDQHIVQGYGEQDHRPVHPRRIRPSPEFMNGCAIRTTITATRPTSPAIVVTATTSLRSSNLDRADYGLLMAVRRMASARR